MTEKTNEKAGLKTDRSKPLTPQEIAAQANKALASKNSRAACKGAFVLDNNELKEGAAK